MSKSSVPLNLTVRQREDDVGDIMRLRLVSQDGAPLPAFTAGAHIDIQVPGISPPLWRQYSLCSDVTDLSQYEIGILKDPASRGGSKTLHELIRTGAPLLAEGPRNLFPLEESATHSILFGGGIGITPMLAMAKRLHALGKDFTLHYCTRTKANTAFRADLESAPFHAQVRFHHDDGPPTQRLNLEQDLPTATAATHVYVCGPSGFMDWVIAGAEARGYGSDKIHREYFSAEIDQSGESFEVEARASGVTVTVGPQDSIAKALARAGVKIQVKCEEGVCGTCLTPVLDGIPDHRDKFLTDEERAANEDICACCSRALTSKLVLDV